MNNLLQKINTRSIVILSLLVGATVIAFQDPSFRPVYGNLCSMGIGGYLGLTIPKKGDKNENINSG